METTLKTYTGATSDILETAKALLRNLAPYNDDFSNELKSVLKNHIDKANPNLIESITRIPRPPKFIGFRSLYSENINCLISEILWPAS